MLDVKMICNVCHEMIFLRVYSSEIFMLFFSLSEQKVLPVVLDQHEAISHVTFRYSARFVLCFLVLLACCSFSPEKHHSCSEGICHY